MSDKELLEMYVADVDLFIKILNEGNIDVYKFYEEMVHLNEFFKVRINKDKRV